MALFFLVTTISPGSRPWLASRIPIFNLDSELIEVGGPRELAVFSRGAISLFAACKGLPGAEAMHRSRYVGVLLSSGDRCVVAIQTSGAGALRWLYR